MQQIIPIAGPCLNKNQSIQDQENTAGKSPDENQGWVTC